MLRYLLTNRKFSTLAAGLAGFSLFATSCGLSDVRNSLVDGVMTGISGTTSNVVTSLLPIGDMIAAAFGSA